MSEWDIFISYAHIDNQPLLQGQKGWVEQLHTAINTRLAQLLGRPLKIWRDPKMDGTELVNETLVQRVTGASILLSVLSPAYLKSDWCLKELRVFQESAQGKGGVQVGTKSRIVKVVKTQVPRGKHPTELQGPLGYEFFRVDPTTEDATEFWPELQTLEYLAKLEDLVRGIKRLIDDLNVSNVTTPLPSPPLDKPIYLAETTSDLAADRDNVKRELEQRGYFILPDEEIPIKRAALETQVRAYIQRSRLSVHLLGAPYGMVPETEQRSIPHLQIDLAAERCGQPNFARLLWMPPGLQPADARQQQLIDTVQRTSLPGSELLQTKLEDLKNHIQTKLAPPPTVVTNGHQEQEAPKVYLICDQQDYDETKALDDFLNDNGIKVLQPLLGANDTQSLQQYHNDNLKLCDAVLIYHGHAPQMWAQVKLQDLIKLPGLGRTKLLLAKAIYLAKPSTSEKDRYRYRDLDVIKGYEGFDSAMLKPFLARLTGATS